MSQTYGANSRASNVSIKCTKKTLKMKFLQNGVTSTKLFIKTFIIAKQNASISKPPPTPAQVQEYTVRLPKNSKKVHHVMRFNATLNVDFGKWKNVKMERENNMRDNRMEEAMPKSGAGSEYNRDMKEELRRKRFGISARKYKPGINYCLLFDRFLCKHFCQC